MNEPDERLGLPSCSNFDKYAACPGSYLLEKDCPPLPKEEWTESGTRIHDYIAGFQPGPNFTYGEKEIGDKCIELALRAQEAVGVPELPTEMLVEQRLWLGKREWDKDSKISSGKPDLVITWCPEAFQAPHALIIDYKTGRKEVDPAPKNPQLRGLVAHLAYARSPSKIWVAIVGLYQKPQVSIGVYEQADIKQAQDETWELIDRINQPGQPRYPGDHCHYCRAKAICPELQGLLVAAPSQLGVVGSSVAKTSVEQAVASASDDKLAMLMEGYQLRQWANDAIYEETKRRVKEGRKVGDWTLGKPEKREKINDLGTVFARSQQFCLPDEFQRQCSITKASLKELVADKLSLKGKALDCKVKELVEGCVTESFTEPGLVRKAKEITENAKSLP